MALCDGCKALMGAPADVEPHDQLVSDASIHRTDGILWTYRCTRCHSIWLRFTVNEAYSGGPQQWERVGHMS